MALAHWHEDQHATEDDLRVAIRRATERAGFTYAELADQARRNDFETVRARMAWVAIGGLDHLVTGSVDTSDRTEADVPTPTTADLTFDRITRRELGIPGAEFLARWDAGEYEGIDLDSVPGLVDVWVALPLVR